MQINNFNSGEARMFHDDVKSAVEQVAKSYGVEIEFGGYRYGNGSYKVTVEAKSSAGQARNQAMFDHMCKMHGLDPSIVSYDGHTLVAYHANRPKRCWGVKGPNGKEYIAPTSWVKMRFSNGCINYAATVQRAKPAATTTPASTTQQTNASSLYTSEF